jgi:glycosyltransferase involved in cell wall biosynthesis
MHDALGKICQDHLLGTTTNGDDKAYSFQLHKIFPAHVRRYIPLFGLRKAVGIGRRYDVTHIFCDHPYMAPLAIAASRRLRVPWALRSHNIEAERFRLLKKSWWRVFRAFEEFAMRSADAIFFITEEDRTHAINAYNLRPAKCHLAPYGTNLSSPPAAQPEARIKVAKELSLDSAIPWLYFLGVQSYGPNAEAVGHILNHIYPRLKAAGVKCEIIIAGKGLSQPLQDAIALTGGEVRYTGFIDDLDSFIKACNIMLNPLTSGGGIKTKAVEALAYNKVVVSTTNGASGILPQFCGPNLLVAQDHDWDAYTARVITALHTQPDIPAGFYTYYNWDNIARHVTSVMSELKY